MLNEQTENPVQEIIEPAIHGTVSMLTSASKTPSVRRVVITSSVVAIMPPTAYGDRDNVYSTVDRAPSPSGPYDNYFAAYMASKVFAFDATEKFIEAKKPHFTIVNVMPTFVIGKNELVTDSKHITDGTNFIPMQIILGNKNTTPFTGNIAVLEDVALVHVGSLDEKKVRGNANFLVTSGDGIDGVTLDSALEIAKKHFPEAVEKGILPLGGTTPTSLLRLDVSPTEKVFGPMKTYEDAVKSVVAHYIELVEGEAK
jgi:nucleoside-diphosphate-sugar epimerase